jgi:hypothetical protein
LSCVRHQFDKYLGNGGWNNFIVQKY